VKTVKKVKGPLPFVVEKGDFVRFDAEQLGGLEGPLPEGKRWKFRSSTKAN
jgi:hypothetical protein